MTAERHLDWDGCFNVRDLGGLPTADRLRIRSERLGRTDEDIVAQQLRQASTSAEAAIAMTLASFDAEAYLRDAGLRADQIGAIRARMLDAPDAPCGVLP